MSVDASIHIFPAREMLALDMAELMNASIIGSTILQGCGVTINTSTGVLSMEPGRIVIYGRLGVVAGGTFDIPSDALGTSAITRHLMAVCDLSAEEPFYVKVLTTAEYNTVTTRADSYTDENYNVSSGIRYLDLGTATMASGRFTKWTPNTSNTKIKNLEAVKKELNDRIDKVLDSGNTSNSVATNKSWINYLKKRSHTVSKFQSETKQVAGITVAAGGVTTVRFRKERGSKTYVLSGGGGSAVIDNTIAELWIKPDGTIVDQHGASGSGYIEAKDKYGVPTTINNVDWTAFGILAVGVSGTNANNCVVNAFGISGNYAYVRLRNIGSAKATLTVAIRVLQICEE